MLRSQEWWLRRQISLATASTSGVAMACQTRSARYQESRATKGHVLQHGVARDEGKGVTLVGCEEIEEEEEEGSQSSPFPAGLKS